MQSQSIASHDAWAPTQSGRANPVASKRRISRASGVPSPHNERQEITAQAVFYAEGEPAGSWAKVISGVVIGFKQLDGGRRQIVEVVGPGEFFGLSLDGRRDCTFIAARDSTVEIYHQPGGAVSADLTLTWAPILWRQLVRAREHALMLGKTEAIERLVYFLLKLITQPQASPAPCLMISRGELADYLGLRLETVSRKLSELRAKGILRFDTGDTLVVQDLEALRNLGPRTPDGAPFAA